MPKTIAITGATGFIGQALCKQLLTEGHSVRALARKPSALAHIEGLQIQQGDIANTQSLQALVTGTEAVIHCAGNVRGATQSDFDQVNVDGLRNLLDAITASQTSPRLLCLSSLAAREPDLSFYARSKANSEALLREHPHSLTYAVLRPPAVYGPGDKELLPLLEMMARGYAVIPGAADARFSMIFIDDLIAAIIAWLNNEQAITGIYTLEDGSKGGYDWQTLCATVSDLTGRPIRRLPLPNTLLDIIAWINRTTARRFGYLPMLTPEKLRELRHNNWACDSQALQQALGWQAQTSLCQGIQKTLFGDN